jgi:hypothetical protein
MFGAVSKKTGKDGIKKPWFIESRYQNHNKKYNYCSKRLPAAGFRPRTKELQKFDGRLNFEMRFDYLHWESSNPIKITGTRASKGRCIGRNTGRRIRRNRIKKTKTLKQHPVKRITIWVCFLYSYIKTKPTFYSVLWYQWIYFALLKSIVINCLLFFCRNQYKP